jgi:GNAT superfamily N-acetyltransferase
MGVDPDYQGLGIGYALGKAVLQDARERGAKRVYLESNTILEPAIRLYRKLGFQAFEGRDSPYQRCNIQMEIFFG